MLPHRRATVLALLLAMATVPGPVPAQGAEARPDLVPTALAPAPALNLTAGMAVTFAVQVNNTGNASSPAVNVSFYVGAALLGNATLAPLENGTAANATSPAWNATEGAHSIRAVVDPDGAAEEASEENNELTLDITVEEPPPPLPDLLLVDAGPAEDPQLGEEVALQARVLNAGQGDAGAFVVRFEVDDKPLGNVSVPRLGAGEGVTVAGPKWNVTGGNHTLRVLADAREAVEETSEGNNHFTAPFAAAAAAFEGPDLRVVRIAMDPEHPLIGMPLRFLAHVENRGTAASGPFLVVFTLDNHTLASHRVARLAANAGVVVNSTAWPAGVGNHSLLVEADPGPGNDTASLDNVLPLRFRIPPRTERPDLVLDLLGLPGGIAPGDQVRGTAVVRNNGSWPSPATALRFTMDGERLGADAPVPGLAPGETARITAPPWNATLGPHVFAAKVDPHGGVPERDNVNNARARNFTVARDPEANASVLPDLEVAAIGWDPLDPRDGHEVVLQATVHNGGNRTVGAFRVDFLVDGQLHDQQLVTGIGTNDVVVVSRPWKASPGRHTLGVRLDAAEEHREAEEANNLRYGVVEVPPPGLPFAREVPAAPLPLAVAAALLLAALRPGRPGPKGPPGTR